MKNTYLKVFLILCVLIFGTIATSNAQNDHSEHNHLSSKKIKLSNPSMQTLYEIKDLGIDLTCGAIFTETDLFLELTGEEVVLLESASINFTIEIDNLTQAIAERNAIELPEAISQLENLKTRENQESNTQRSVSTLSTEISNIVQYEGSEEIDWKTPENFELGTMGGCFTYDGMLAELDRMRMEYPNLISIKKDASLAEDGSGTAITTLGNTNDGGGAYDTWPGQVIYYVRISNNPDIDQPDKPESFYSGMTHSREVSSLMNLIFYMWYVLENYDTDPSIKSLVDNHEMYFIPVANPDGLKWNEQIDPNGGGLQRKNLRVAAGQDINGELRGVDLNRNYDYFWGNFAQYPGSSGSVVSNTYRGTAAFSEPETQIAERFVENHDVKTALNHHATSNLLPHAYNGFPNSTGSGREDEYSTFCNEMTRFNRYMYGEAPDVLTVANGDMSDWMLGGAADLNGSTGSGAAILAMAPENGNSNEGSAVGGNSFSGFWPTPTNITNIAKRAVRMNLVSARFSGKLVRFHDFTPMAITSTNTSLDFGLEYLGQTLGDVDLTITPISNNITSIGTISTQTGWTKLEQRQVSAAIALDPAINSGDEIQYEVTLASGSYIIHKAIIRKVYNPGIIFQDNPDVDGISNWTATGTWGIDSDGFNGTSGIGDSPSSSYSDDENSSITLANDLDISAFAKAVITFNATWDVERSFDYVQLQASPDNGTTWIPLSGKYTKPGATLDTTPYNSNSSSDNGGTSEGKLNADRDNQPDGEPIYEGYKLEKWVLEEVVIDDDENGLLFQSDDLRLRFVFDSDGSNRSDGYSTTFDGFIFDNFTVTGVDVTSPCREELTASDLPYAEGLNAGIGLWRQSGGDDGNWTVDGDGTASGGTGPSAPFEGSDYLYIEATDPGVTSDPNAIGFPNKKAILNSPCLDLTEFSNAEITFRYHMFSSDADPAMGSLEVEVSIDEGLTWNSAFSISGNQGDIWNLATVNLDAYTGNIARLRLIGTTGTTFRSDIAIDDINISAGTSSYVYDAGAWSPNDPSGIATPVDTITVLSDTGELTADTTIKNVTIAPGATLALGTTILTIKEDIINNGSMDADEASILLNGENAQSITGVAFELGNLTVNNSSGVTISVPIEIKSLLTLTSGELNSNGNLTLGSDLNGSAMIAPITGGSITGNVITEQYIPAKRAFRLIGSTVTTTSTIQSNWQESLSSAPSFGTHITGSTDGSNGFDATGSGNYSLFTLNNANQAWEAVTNTDVNTLTAGQPLRLMVRGDRTIDLTSNSSPATITTLRATGQLATGTITTTGASLNHTANAFNFIGNPYQASVNVNDVLGASNNINSNQIFVWDATLGSRGQYVTVTLDGIGSSNGANAKNYHFLQPGQAVFTRTLSTVTDNSTSVIFAENHKVVDQNIPVYANQTNDLFTSAHIIGRLYRTEKYGLDEGLQDNFVILFNSEYDNEITPSDASKFYNIDENMAISNGETLLSIEQRAMPEEGEELQFFNALYRTSEYTLDIDIAGLEGVTPYFVDTFTQTSTMLGEGWNTIYFTVDQDTEESTASNRFKITYTIDELSIGNAQNTQIALYPNPITEGALTITASTLIGQDAQIVLHNILGQQVYTSQVTFTNGTTTIYNLNNLQSGVYFMTVQNDTLKSTQRIIVK